MPRLKSVFDLQPQGYFSTEAEYDNLESPVTFLDSFAASVKLSAEDAPLVALSRIQGLKAIEANAREDAEAQGLKLDYLEPEDLNQRFVDSGVQFKERLPIPVAEEIVRRQERRMELERIASFHDGAMSKTAQFVGGFLPHIFDPINLGATVITAGAINGLASGIFARVAGGRIISTAAGRTFKAAPLSRVLGRGMTRKLHTLAVGPATLGGRTALAAVEDVIATTPVELLALNARKQEFRDYTATEFFVNTVGGALGFAGLRFGFGKAAGYMSRRSLAKRRLFETKLGEAVNDVIPNTVDTEVRMAALETHADSQGYNFQKMDAFNQNQKRLFGHQRKKRSEFSRHNIEVQGRDFGEGLYFDDNPDVANNHATSRGRDTPSNIVEVQLDPNARLLDLDQPLNDNLREAANTRFFEGKEVVEPGTTGLEFYDKVKNEIEEGRLPDTAIDEINEGVKELGFDGIHYAEKATEFGDEVNPHNAVVVFNDSKVQLRSINEPDPSRRTPLNHRQMVDERQKALNDPKNKMDFDPEYEAQLMAVESKLQSEVPKLAELNKQVDEAADDLAELESQNLVEEADRLNIDEHRTEVQREAIQEDAMKKAIVCGELNG